MSARLLDRDQFLTRWSELHGGYDPRTGSVLVRGWLGLVVLLAAPLRRLHPHVLTGLGVAVAGFACWTAGFAPWLAALVVLVSALFDGLDGAVAVLTRRESRFGFVLDSVADRVADGLFLVALWRAGAGPGACVAAGAAVAMLEYGRARAAAAGLDEIGVVTVGERPIRVAVTVLALCCAPAAGAWALLALGIVGLVQLLVVVRRRLV